MCHWDPCGKVGSRCRPSQQRGLQRQMVCEHIGNRRITTNVVVWCRKDEHLDITPASSSESPNWMARFETAWATLSTCQVRSFYKLLTESKADKNLKVCSKSPPASSHHRWTSGSGSPLLLWIIQGHQKFNNAVIGQKDTCRWEFCCQQWAQRRRKQCESQSPQSSLMEGGVLSVNKLTWVILLNGSSFGVCWLEGWRTVIG